MYKILVIDDEARITEVLEDFLTKNGFEVVRGQGGREAIAVLNSGIKPDLMLLDMKMPKVAGLDVLKEMERTNLKIPIIILTGSVDTEKYVEDLNKLGYSRADIVYKPVNLSELLETVKNKLYA